MNDWTSIQFANNKMIIIRVLAFYLYKTKLLVINLCFLNTLRLQNHYNHTPHVYEQTPKKKKLILGNVGACVKNVYDSRKHQNDHWECWIKLVNVNGHRVLGSNLGTCR